MLLLLPLLVFLLLPPQLLLRLGARLQAGQRVRWLRLQVGLPRLGLGLGLGLPLLSRLQLPLRLLLMPLLLHLLPLLLRVQLRLLLNLNPEL